MPHAVSNAGISRLVAIESGDWVPALRPMPVGRVAVAIGDVHGHAALLEAMHGAIAAVLPDGDATVVHLGDLIDRGPSSRGAIALARRGIPGTANLVLTGNHEDILVRALRGDDEAARAKWLRMGGSTVLAEYGIEPEDGWPARLRAAMEPGLVGWLEGLPHIHRIGDIVFVHGGIEPDRPLAEQRREDCLWIWDRWIAADGPFDQNVGVIHGHIPVDEVNLAHPHKIDIDTRIYASGRLSALVLHGERMRLIQAAYSD
jgi:serine/threonine protein phosphatase 1